MYLINEAAFTFILLFLTSFFDGSTADLESKNVREGSTCRIVSPDDVNYDERFIFGPKRYYAPVASKSNLFLQAEVLLNRSARNYEELERMCRTIEVNMEGFVLERGYDRSLTQNCVPLERRGQYNCTGTFASAGTNPAPFAKYIINILASDNKTWALLTRCTTGSVESYELLTTTPDIEKTSTSFAEVRRNITKLGFNPSYTIELGCKKCSRKDYEGQDRFLLNKIED